MTDAEQLSALHTAVTSYLSTLLAISDCVGAACPEVGGPYRHRLSRLRSRLAFDCNPEAMTESNEAVEMETTPYPTDPAHLSEVVQLQAAQLLGCVESMGNDTKSLVVRMREELAAVTQRLEDAEVTDRLTGLMNRKEMERQIEQRRAEGVEPVLVVFELSGDVRD